MVVDSKRILLGVSYDGSIVELLIDALKNTSSARAENDLAIVIRFST